MARREQVWCMVSKVEGHLANDFPTLRDGVVPPYSTQPPFLSRSANEYYANF